MLVQEKKKKPKKEVELAEKGLGKGEERHRKGEDLEAAR
jgi:hypothetical protein